MGESHTGILNIASESLKGAMYMMIYAVRPQEVIEKMREISKIEPWNEPDLYERVKPFCEIGSKNGKDIKFPDKDKFIDCIGKTSGVQRECVADGKNAVLTYEENPRLFDDPETGKTEVRIFGNILLQERETGRIMYFTECPNDQEAKNILSKMLNVSVDAESTPLNNETVESERDVQTIETETREKT